MGAWPRDKIRSSLMSKGFTLATDRDHDFLTFSVEGKTRAIFTKLSRGRRDKDYHDGLLAAMSKQLKVTRKQLDQLISCTMGHPEYTEHLRGLGIIR